MGEFSEHQPKPGQIVAVCKHLAPDGELGMDEKVAYFEITGKARNLVNIDKATGKAAALGHVDWLACCTSCLIEAEGDATQVDYAGTTIWIETKPVIREGS
jgi:hypothetical protein